MSRQEPDEQSAPDARGGRDAAGGGPRGPRPGGHAGMGVPVEKPSDFAGSARRLLGRLTPYRMLIALSVLLSVGAVTLSTLGPRVLGRATDFIFAGYLGNRLGEVQRGGDFSGRHSAFATAGQQAEGAQLQGLRGELATQDVVQAVMAAEALTSSFAPAREPMRCVVVPPAPTSSTITESPTSRTRSTVGTVPVAAAASRCAAT